MALEGRGLVLGKVGVEPVQENTRSLSRAPPRPVPRSLTPAYFPTGTRLEGRQGMHSREEDLVLAPRVMVVMKMRRRQEKAAMETFIFPQTEPLPEES